MSLAVDVRAARTAARRVGSERGALVVTGVFYLMVTAMLAALWSAAGGVNSGSIAGYSTAALIWYVATTEVATISLPQRLIEYVGVDIASNAIEVELLRPASMLRIRVMTELGAMLPRAAVCSGVGLVLAFVLAGPPPSAASLLLAVPALLLALSLNVVAQHAFAASAFWVHDATATWFLYQKLIFVVGGMLLPLEVLPDTLEAIARWLPFMAMAYVPARLASGNFEPELMLVQGFWLLVLAAVAAWLFSLGERRLMVARP